MYSIWQRRWKGEVCGEPLKRSNVWWRAGRPWCGNSKRLTLARDGRNQAILNVLRRKWEYIRHSQKKKNRSTESNQCGLITKMRICECVSLSLCKMRVTQEERKYECIINQTYEKKTNNDLDNAKIYNCHTMSSELSRDRRQLHPLNLVFKLFC